MGLALAPTSSGWLVNQNPCNFLMSKQVRLGTLQLLFPEPPRTQGQLCSPAAFPPASLCARAGFLFLHPVDMPGVPSAQRGWTQEEPCACVCKGVHVWAVWRVAQSSLAAGRAPCVGRKGKSLQTGISLRIGTTRGFCLRGKDSLGRGT